MTPAREEWESKAKYRNLQETTYGEEVRIAFDPALSFARDIQVSLTAVKCCASYMNADQMFQRLYGDALLVFHDRHGGNIIGLLWNPEKSVARSFKPFLGCSTQPAGSEVGPALYPQHITANDSRLP